jgi:hypothetical protein
MFITVTEWLWRPYTVSQWVWPPERYEDGCSALMQVLYSVVDCNCQRGRRCMRIATDPFMMAGPLSAAVGRPDRRIVGA